MIDPLLLIQNDMADFIMSSRNVFENWNDSASHKFGSECVGRMQNDYKLYINQMNTNMRIYMRAEKRINEDMQRLQDLISDI